MVILGSVASKSPAKARFQAVAGTNQVKITMAGSIAARSAAAAPTPLSRCPAARSLPHMQMPPSLLLLSACSLALPARGQVAHD